MERISIDCARVMRGMNSIASALEPGLGVSGDIVARGGRDRARRPACAPLAAPLSVAGSGPAMQRMMSASFSDVGPAADAGARGLDSRHRRSRPFRRRRTRRPLGAERGEFLHRFGDGGDAGLAVRFMQDRDLHGRSSLVCDDVDDDSRDDRDNHDSPLHEVHEAQVIAHMHREVGIVSAFSVRKIAIFDPWQDKFREGLTNRSASSQAL